MLTRPPVCALNLMHTSAYPPRCGNITLPVGCDALIGEDIDSRGWSFLVVVVVVAVAVAFVLGVDMIDIVMVHFLEGAVDDADCGVKQTTAALRHNYYYFRHCFS